MFKIASVSGAEPQTPLEELTTLLRHPSRHGLLAFGNRSFAPSALALSPIYSISVSQFLQYLSPEVMYRFTPLCTGPLLIFL